MYIPRDSDHPLREKVEAKDSELKELTAWKDVQITKLDYTKQPLKVLKAQVEALKKILKDKEAEISEAKHHLHQAKEDAVQEYRDSNALLKELGGSFANSFDDYFCKVKASFFDLDLSHVSIDAQAQTLAQPIYSEGTDELFVDETNLDPQGDSDGVNVNQEKFKDTARHLEGEQTMEKMAEDTPAV